MKTFKRIIASTLSVLMILASLLTVNVFAETVTFPDVADDNPYKGAIYSLVEAGIINGIDENGVLKYKPENTITRAEFAKLIAVKLAGNVALSETTDKFPDVAKDYWANPYIAYAVKAGIINGNPDGTFRPFNPVTYGEAVKMLVCAKGYGSLYTPTNPWYAGYIQLANKIDLTKYAQGYGENEASRGLVAQLIYNMDFCRNIEVSQPGGGPTFEDDEEYEELDGVVEGVYETSLTGQRLGLNKLQVMIDGQKFGIGEYNLDKFYPYLGKMVTIRYKENSKNEIVSIVESGNNNKITIEASLIDEISSDAIEYYESETSSKTQTAKLDEDLYIIYNGVGVDVKSDDFDKEKFIKEYFNIDSGDITLMNNDGGKDYEIAYITSYKTYYVSAKSSSNGVYTITDQNNINGSTVVLDEDDCTVSKISAVGGKMSSSSLSSITSKSVISVAEPYDRKEGTEVIISAIKVTSGEVDELDGTDYIRISDKDYTYSDYYNALEKKNPEEYTLSVGDKAAFYFDYAGKLVFMTKSESTDDNYAYIVGYQEGNGLNSTSWLKLYTISGSSGKIIDAYIDNDFDFNGKSVEGSSVGGLLKDKAEELNDAFSGKIENGDYAQLIKYKSYTDRDGVTCIDEIETLDPSASAETLSYKSKAFSKDGKSQFVINSSTIIIQVPDDRTDEDGYKKKSTSSFYDGNNYKVEAYDIKSNAAKVVLYYNGVSNTAIGAGNNVAFVKSIRGANSPKDSKKTVDQLTFYYAGKTEPEDPPIYTEKRNMLDGEVEIGDLIRFAIDDGEIVNVQKLFVDGVLYETNGTEAKDNIVEQAYNSDKDYYYVMYGTVQTVDGNSIMVVPQIVTDHDDYDEDAWENFNTDSSTKIYKLNATEDDYETDVELGSLQSVDLTQDATTASKVVVIRINDKIKAIYVVE